jgi:hypothetical protein
LKIPNFHKLIGKWKTEGTILKTSENPEMKITGTDSYEIILDGFFILHMADVRMGNVKSQTYEIIGMGANSQATMQYYNNRGLSGKMTSTLVDNEFVINGDGLRFRGLFSEDSKAIAGTWEKLTDEKDWVEYLKMNFTKIE